MVRARVAIEGSLMNATEVDDPDLREFAREVSALLAVAGSSFEGIARAIDALDHPTDPDPLVLAVFEGCGQPYLDFIERVQLRLEHALDDLSPSTVSYRGVPDEAVSDQISEWLEAVRIDFLQSRRSKRRSTRKQK